MGLFLRNGIVQVRRIVYLSHGTSVEGQRRKTIIGQMARCFWWFLKEKICGKVFTLPKKVFLCQRQWQSVISTLKSIWDIGDKNDWHQKTTPQALKWPKNEWNKMKQEKALVSDSATNAIKPRPAVPFGSGAVSGGMVLIWCRVALKYRWNGNKSGVFCGIKDF